MRVGQVAGKRRCSENERGNPCCRAEAAQQSATNAPPTGGSNDRITQTVLETEESERPPDRNRGPVRVGEWKDSRTGTTFQGDRFDRRLREMFRFYFEVPRGGRRDGFLAESLERFEVDARRVRGRRG